MDNQIFPVEFDDDAVSAFDRSISASKERDDLEWLRSLPSETKPNASADIQPDVGVDIEQGDDEGGAIDLMKRGVVDVFHGVGESAPAAASGVLNAFDEVSDLLEGLLPTGALQVYDSDKGEFTFRYLNSDEFADVDAVHGSILEKLQSEPSSNTGGFIKSTAQFLTGFIPALKAVKAAGVGTKVATGAPLVAEMGAGAIADAVVFDPFEERLSTYLNEVPALQAIVPDYLADNDPANQSEWEGRLKNAIEGAGIGLAAEGLVRAFKYYKAQRAAGGGPRDPMSAQEAAARDQLIEDAKADFIQPVDDASVAPLGDPDADDLLVMSEGDETLASALDRVEEAKRRVEREGVISNALEQIDAAMQGLSADDPMGEVLDMLRGGSAARELPRRPAADALKSRGGIHPQGSIATELKARGINTKTHPGLFRSNGGLSDLDNLVRSEIEIFGQGEEFISPQEWIDALEAEAAGTPLRTVDQQQIAELAQVADQIDAELNNLGINLDELSNEDVVARVNQARDEAAQFARSGEEIPDASFPEGFDPDIEADPNIRTLESLSAEDAEIWRSLDEAERAKQFPGIDPVSGKKQGKIFINHARIREPDDVKNLIQILADQDAEAINAKRGGETVTTEKMITDADAEYKELTDLIGREPGPMSASQAIAARRIMNASAEQVMDLAKAASSNTASNADLFNFRRAMVAHYAIQAEVIAARTETARALRSWGVHIGSSKGARTICAI